MRFCVCLCVLLISACTKNPATNKLDFMVLDEVEEYQLGRDSKNTVSKSKFYKDLKTQEYYRNLAEKVYAVGERPDKNFSFYFLDDDVVNAAATPGYMFLNRGLLPYIQDEAALMGVLAHEAGHINARHSAKKVSFDVAKDWAWGGVFALNRKIEQDAFNMSYSRSLENEADLLAVRYLNKLEVPAENTVQNYQAFAKLDELNLKMHNLNENLKAKKQSNHSILDSHPIPESRVSQIEEKTKHHYLIEPYKQKEFYNKINGLEYGYSGKGKQEFEFIESKGSILIKKNSLAGVYGFKNTAYMKKQGLKVNLPKLYQARIKTSDPLAYNYQKDVLVEIFEQSDDRYFTSLDLIAKMLGLKAHAKQRFMQDVRKGKDTGYIKMLTADYADKLGESEELFSLKKSSNWFYDLFDINSQYFYFYIKQLNNLDNFGKHNSYENNFRVIILSSNSKKSFDEVMLDDILFIKDNLKQLSSKEKAKIKPLAIKTIKAKGDETVEQLSQDNIPYINFNQEWFKLINGLYDDYNADIKNGQWLKLIPNPNKDI